MASIAHSLGTFRKPWYWIAIGGSVMLIWAAIAIPNLRSVRVAPHGPSVAEDFAPAAPTNGRLSLYQERDSVKLISDAAAPVAASESGRKLVRTSSLSMVVQHPAEIAQRITVLAQNLGGYLVSEDGGGQSATSGALTIRVPAARFEEARAELRKLGLRVENEKVEAQDVTRQYVDQDASLRNLHAEEAQYLSIMKQARTVKDMLAVTEKLSDVRGQIEQQQAEFNALSRQVETVSIAISLHTESEAQVAWLNWRPLYQVKMALRDGLESLANYAAAMITIFFYLPAALAWAGTILGSILIGAKLLRWAAMHWLGWKPTATSSPQ
jgi:hypothetical protein